jgi:hypothetical protein
MTDLSLKAAAPLPRPAAGPAGNAANVEEPLIDLRPQRYLLLNCRTPFQGQPC